MRVPATFFSGNPEKQKKYYDAGAGVQEQYKTPFLPLMAGGVECKFQDLDAARSAIVKGRTCAVFVEPLQGEGGVNASTQCAAAAAATTPL